MLGGRAGLGAAEIRAKTRLGIFLPRSGPNKEAMKRCLALTLLLAGCASPTSPPDHPLVGTWQGVKPLTLKTTEYQFGSETGFWSAGRSDFSYKKSAAGPFTSSGSEHCDFSLTGRVLVMSGCRLAGRYTRTP
jgi:hypothetical protein